MLFSTWVIWQLLKCLESFVRSQSTNFGLWIALASPYPSRSYQTCLSRLPKNTHPLHRQGTFLLWRLFGHYVRCLTVPMSLDQCKFGSYAVVCGCNYCPLQSKHKIMAPKPTATMLGKLRFFRSWNSLIWHFKITVGIGEVQKGHLTPSTSTIWPITFSLGHSRAARRTTSLTFVALALRDEEF